MRDFIHYNRRTIVNILIFIFFFLPVIIALYLALFNFKFSSEQINSLICLFGIGICLLFPNNIQINTFKDGWIAAE